MNGWPELEAQTENRDTDDVQMGPGHGPEQRGSLCSLPSLTSQAGGFLLLKWGVGVWGKSPGLLRQKLKLQPEPALEAQKHTQSS